MLKFNSFTLWITLLMLLGSLTESRSQVAFNGDITAVSTYVWRGIKQYNGPALQATASASYKNVTVGLWSSSVNFNGSEEVETDPFVEITMPINAFDVAIGAVAYSYDLFESFNDDADLEAEIYTTIGFNAFGLSVYYVPSQSSTEHTPNDSDYWMEFSASMSKGSYDLGILIAYGTYSARYLPTPDKDPISVLFLNVNKNLNEQFSLNWNYSWGFHKNMDNIFWVGCSYSF